MDPGTDALVHTDASYNEQPNNLYYSSPLYTLWRIRRGDNPDCPLCSNITMPNVLNEQWLETHPEYSPDDDPFAAIVEQAFAEGAETFNGLTPADLDDLRRTYSLIRTSDELARGEGWVKVLLKLGSELGLPLIGAVGMAASKLGSEARQAIALQGQQTSGRFPRTAGPNRILYRTDSSGAITNYQVYDSNGNPVMRVDLQGRSHGGVPTPHVHEFERHIAPNGTVYIKSSGTVRPATPNEIP
jgi:hypothetical protein